jgi:hypothetical protein
MKNMEMPQNQKNQGQFEINFNQPEQVDSKGRNKKEIMKQYKLANESLLSFDSVSREWKIENMSPLKWKNKMDNLYKESPDDFTKGQW